jgi:NitT/TauT family transport system substrate-binding protein
MRSLKTVVGVVGLVVGLAACAGPAPAATGTDGRTVVRYQDYGASLTALPVLEAERSDLYAAHGIELQKGAPIYNSGQLVQSLLQGEADIVVAGASAALAAVGQGQQVRVVGNLSSPQIQVALTSTALADLATRGITPDSPVEAKVAALRGLSLATPASGTQSELHFRFLAAHYGLAPDRDLVLQPFSEASAIVAAAKQGGTAGIVSVPPQTVLPETEGWGRVFIDFAREAPDLVAMPGTSVVTTPRFLQQNPEAVKSFLAAMSESRTQLRAATDADATALRERFFPDMAAPTFLASFRSLEASLVAPIQVAPPQFDLMLDVLGSGTAGRPDVTFEQFFDAAPSAGLEGAG